MRKLGSIGALVLLFLFFCSAAMLVVLGVTTYEKLTRSGEEQLNMRMSIQYLEDKVHQYDYQDAISVREIQGTEVLVFTKQEEQDTYETWLYGYESNLCEISNHKVGERAKLSEGKVIAKVAVLSIHAVRPNLIKVKLKDQEDREYICVLVVRSNLEAVPHET